jgi:hypothetical protein
MNKLLVVLLLVVSGCHAEAPRVRCNRELQPINTPAPAVKEPSVPSVTP